MNDIEYDRCNLCGIETKYTRETHIINRAHYVEGAGQLCSDCWNKTYKEKK